MLTREQEENIIFYSAETTSKIRLSIFEFFMTLISYDWMTMGVKIRPFV